MGDGSVMDMMALRKKIISQMTPKGVGIFTKGYEAVLSPQSASEFVVTHNLGVKPRVMFLELVDGTVQNANYVIYCIADFDTYLEDDKTGYFTYLYHYNNSDSTSSDSFPTSTKITANETTLTMAQLFSSIRTPWDTGAQYRVDIWG